MSLMKRGEVWYFKKMINGRRFRRSTRLGDRKLAELCAADLEHEIRSQLRTGESKLPSFATWWGIYMKTYTPLKSSKVRDLTIVAHFVPHFGARPLDTITRSDIVWYLSFRRTQMTASPGHKKQRPISESTVRRERSLLQAIFERAIDEGYAFRNPFHGIKCGKDMPRTRVLNLEEEAKLLDAMRPRFQRFVRFALGTGARLSEIRGIDPDRDVDWQDGAVHVLGKFKKARWIPMQPDALAALQEQLALEGKLWNQHPQRLREVIAKGAEQAGIPHLTPHTLRHTYGTRWLQVGGDIYKLSRILGHTSVVVTEAHYAHLLKADLIAASRQVRLPIANRSSSSMGPIR
jgi:integrase